LDAPAVFLHRTASPPVSRESGGILGRAANQGGLPSFYTVRRWRGMVRCQPLDWNSPSEG
ncbi:hypothetical protein, partial [Paracoccus yeei]